jgi:hypothetical protein
LFIGTFGILFIGPAGAPNSNNFGFNPVLWFWKYVTEVVTNNNFIVAVLALIGATIGVTIGVVTMFLHTQETPVVMPSGGIDPQALDLARQLIQEWSLLNVSDLSDTYADQFYEFLKQFEEFRSRSSTYERDYFVRNWNRRFNTNLTFEQIKDLIYGKLLQNEHLS